MRRMLIVCAIVASPAAADTLGDVKAALKRMSANEPVRATLTIEQSVSSAGRFGNNQYARIASAEVSHDANGVTITIPQRLVRKAWDDAVSPGEQGDSAEDAIGSIRAVAVVQALNVRDLLLSMLDNAAIVEEKRVMLHRQPVQLLVLKLQPRRPRSNSIQIGSVKSEDRLMLWIGDDHLPVAAERVQSTTAGFMFLKGTYSGRSSYTFAHTRDRLVLARVETTEGGSGIGQKFDRKSVQTLTVH